MTLTSTSARVRRLSALAAPALLVLSLTACGGGGAPTDASKEDFCEAYNAEPDIDESLGDASPEEQAEAIKTELDKLVETYEEVGTPSDIPDDAREGFEISVDAVKEISEDEILTAIEEEDDTFFEEFVTGEDKEKADAFEEWASGYCG